MREQLRKLALLCAVALVAAPVALADNHAFVEEAKARLATLQEKFVALAEATPADRLGYRPSEEVRSTAELFLHVSGGNYFVARAFGTPPPEGLELRGLEKSTMDKAEIVSRIKASFEHIGGAIGSVGAGDAEKPMRMFGRETTTRGALWTALGHLSEHLGQSIAYARGNGVTPPWSQ